MALVGPSGSGKTTLLAIVAGLLSPTSGSVAIDGEELAELTEAERARFRRRKIGFTFQSNNLIPYLTARGERGVHPAHQRGPERRGQGPRAGAPGAPRPGRTGSASLPRQLSGGQRQRVAIARALVNQPSLVLADEPTASLDSERAVQVVQTLANLVHEQGRAGIMVTHDLRLVEYTDRIIQLVDGRLARSIGPKDDLTCLANPAECTMIPAEVMGV